MNRRRSLTRLFTAAAVAATVGPLGLIVPPPGARAATPQDAAAPQSRVARTGKAARNPSERPLSEVLAAIGRGANATVVADSSVGVLPVVPPAEPTTPQNFEAQIAAIVKALPPGATWAKLYLPTPPTRQRGYSTIFAFNGDAVADYALAQARLFGPVGAPNAPGMVEILGRRLPSDKAQAYIDGLGLVPVYLVTNPSAHSAPGFGLNGDAGQWGGMNPGQRQAWASQQAQQLLGMDPATRNQLMQQNFMVFSQFMKQLPPEEQQSVFQGMLGPNANVQFNFKAAPADGGN